MTPSPPVRKPSRQGGFQVRICGKVIQKGDNRDLVCTLSPSPHKTHAAVAVSETGQVYAFIKNSLPNGEVEVWQITDE